jgi:hypothetical protein
VASAISTRAWNDAARDRRPDRRSGRGTDPPGDARRRQALHEARVDVHHAERLFRFYGEVADKLPTEKLTVDGGFAFTDRIPHGVTGHITPWNYPIQLFARTSRRRSRWATRAS